MITLAQQIVAVIMDELDDRSGISDAIDSIDEKVLAELLLVLEKQVQEILDK